MTQMSQMKFKSHPHLHLSVLLRHMWKRTGEPSSRIHPAVAGQVLQHLRHLRKNKRRACEPPAERIYLGVNTIRFTSSRRLPKLSNNPRSLPVAFR